MSTRTSPSMDSVVDLTAMDEGDDDDFQPTFKKAAKKKDVEKRGRPTNWN